MKRIICFLAAAWLLLLPVFAEEPEPEWTLDLPEDYITAGVSDDMTQLAAVFGIPEETLRRLYTEEDLLFAGADADNTRQIRLFCTENEFSAGAVSFSRFSEEALLSLADTFADDSFENAGVITGEDGTHYIRLIKRMTDSGGAYTVTQYLTVCNAKLYTLNVSVSGTDGESAAEAALAGLHLTDATAQLEDEHDQRSAWLGLLAAVGIALFAAAAVVLTVTVVRDLRKK